MSQHLRAAVLCAVVAALFVVLQIAVQIQTGMAGVFIMGAAGGLLLGDRIAKASPASPAA